MTEDAKPASRSRSSVPVRGILTIERMAAYRAEHPEATEYSIASEAEARELLLTIAEQVRISVSTERDQMKRGAMKAAERAFRLAAMEGRALKYIDELNEEEPLEIYGLKIVVPAVVIRQ